MSVTRGADTLRGEHHSTTHCANTHHSSPFHPRASGYRRNRPSRLSPDRLGHPTSRHNGDTPNIFIGFHCTILPGAVQLIGSYT